MKDSIQVMDIYKRYLNITADLITILERHFKDLQDADGDISEELKLKYSEFRKHAHSIIESLNVDLHSLLKIDWELKEIEDKENGNG